MDSYLAGANVVFALALAGFALLMTLLFAAIGALVALPAALWHHQWVILLVPAMVGAGLGLIVFGVILIVKLL